MPPPATFCPELIHRARRENQKFRAEVEFFDALSRQLPHGWHVFYNSGWVNRDQRGQLRDGEADFIVGHRVYGVLVIELKGGVIGIEGNHQQWTSTDRGGTTHKIKNPFNQATTSKHTLIEKILEQPFWGKKWVGLHHAVAFPDTPRTREHAHAEAPPHIIIWREDMAALQHRLQEIMQFSYGAEPFRHGADIIDSLHKILCRTVKLANPLRAQIDAESREIQTLTDSQIDAFAKLQRIRRVSVGGGAGSGKTYVAVHRARQLAREGFNTLFTCRSLKLASYLHSLLKDTDNVTVQAAENLARRYAPSLPEGATDQVMAENLFDAAMALCPRPYDAIFIDEGQDFAPEWWPALESLLVDGRDGVFFVCHDTNNQAIRPGAGPLPNDLVEVVLEENVRNTPDICEALTPYYHSDVALRPRLSRGRRVEFHAYDAGGLSQRLGKILNRLLVTEGLPARDLVVLTPRTQSDTELTRVVLPAGIRLTESEEDVRGRCVLWANVADFKGLERPVVIVTEVDEQLPAAPRERDAVLYVAFSRARHLLMVLHTGEARFVTTKLP
jgi:hypothetical protein